MQSNFIYNFTCQFVGIPIAAFTYIDFAAKSQQLCSKITTNKIARCEHHGKICSKKHSLAKSLQNRSNFAAKLIANMFAICAKFCLDDFAAKSLYVIAAYRILYLALNATLGTLSFIILIHLRILYLLNIATTIEHFLSLGIHLITYAVQW